MNWKSVLAVVAGVFFIIIVTTLVDIALYTTGVYSPNEPLSDSLAALATAYRIPIAVIGAWLTARLAPRKPVKHALILGGVGAVLGLIGAVATWGNGLGPHWYPIALIILALPQCWLGGWLYESMSRK